MKKILSAAFLLLIFVAFISCSISMIPTKDEWYTKHYIIMQDFERQLYRDLSPAARLEFQKLFWEARDPESKKIFDERMNFVMKTYKRDNSRQPWNCDRARIYMLNGSPASIDSKQMDDWATQVQQGGGVSGAAGGSDRTNEDISGNYAEIWTYQYDKYLVQYAFTFKPPNEWRMAQAQFAGNRYIGALENQSKEMTYGILNPDQYGQQLERLKDMK
jgi:GWxTD domain-containing protein